MTDRDQLPPAARFVVGGVVLAVLVGLGVVVATGVFGVPPPPNPLADGSPEVLGSAGGASYVETVRVTEDRREEPKLTLSLSDRSEPVVVLVRDGDGSRVGGPTTVEPRRASVTVTFVPRGVAEVDWRPTNPYTVAVRGTRSGAVHRLTVRIPYAAK